MTTNPFEDENGTYLVLTNAEGQFSLWPDGITVPGGWDVAMTASSRADCLAFVEDRWTDISPARTAADG
ncbi:MULTISPECIES: MbtH family protein [unclassified Streptomyces]|uniref:MbtH family protein n=1 Tax=unclassified Streptomyces TaxID=2593676 RepID=UPI0023667BBD|nr:MULTISPECIES: MbtH family protein [unclassified Streptomyces]MDF3147444.1 MbtH family protein [Streptomyces sp. T21Q-yed]WDF41247.1 MbtH family protein [Streptomyces sp. T12]